MSRWARSGSPQKAGGLDTAGAPGMDTAVSPDPLGAAAVAALRVGVAVLWLVNVGWKLPPEFERDQGGLHLFTSWAVEFEVFAPWAWVVREIVLPNFVLFAWVVFLTEAFLGGFLLVGLLTRGWALVGFVQSAAITLSVLNAPHEWPWSYYLMMAANLMLFATAAGRAWGLDGVLRPAWSSRSGRLSRLALKLS